MKLLETVKRINKETEYDVLKKMSEDIFKLIDNATTNNIFIINDNEDTVELKIVIPSFKRLINQMSIITLNQIWMIMKINHPEILDINEDESLKATVYLKIKK